MFQSLDIHSFLSDSYGKKNVIDVRSPGEFMQGHIPGATSVPLFTNEERAEIGTLYKQKGRQPAVMRGLEIVGPKLEQLVSQAVSCAHNDELFVHCWRGGMRSGFVATLLDMYGLRVYTLRGGYKKFRNFVLDGFDYPGALVLLGGKTGSGKTRILHRLSECGEQVIDLEGLANHKGSAFGALGEKEQPTQEQFENELSVLLAGMDHSKPVWLEDESRMIGKKVIPARMWEKMRLAKLFFLNLPFSERLAYIAKEYGKFQKNDLETSILKISKRLGPEQTKNAVAALHEGDMETAFGYCLHYYDKTYAHGLTTREQPDIEEIVINKFDIETTCDTLIKKLRAAC